MSLNWAVRISSFLVVQAERERMSSISAMDLQRYESALYGAMSERLPWVVAKQRVSPLSRQCASDHLDLTIAIGKRLR